MVDEKDGVEERMEKSMATVRNTTKRVTAATTPITAPRLDGPANVAKSLSPAAHQQAVHQVRVDDAFHYPVAFKLAFLGAGQGGSRLAAAFWKIGYRRVAVMNTTDMDFEGIDDAIARLNLAVGGTHKDPSLAAAALHGREEEVWDLMTRAFGNDADYVLITVGLGGGTGSGTCAGLVKTARKYLESKGRPARVGAVVSLPTTDGQQEARNAVNAFKALLDLQVAPLIVLDNVRIHQLYRPGFTDLYPKANDTVSQLLHVFNFYGAVHSPYITFDQSELGQLLDGGIVVMAAADIGVADIKSPADISSRIRDQLANTTLAQVDLRRGKKAVLLFVGSAEVLRDFSLDFFDAGFMQLERIIGSAYSDGVPPVIHRGVYASDEAGLQVYTLISELDPPVLRLAELAKKGMITTASNPRGLATFLRIQD